jgi:signal transduction histidine kinase/streptogramin lyase
MGAGGALIRLDRKTGDYKALDPLGRSAPIEVLTIREDSAGSLWVGGLGIGLQRMDMRTGEFKSYRHHPDERSSISSDIVTKLFFDSAGTMWALTWNGLDKFDPNTDQFTTFKREPNTTAEAYFAITQDHDGLFWLGSSNALFSFDPKSSRFTAFRHDSSNPSSLSNNTVPTAYVDRSGSVWIGTGNGLNLLDRPSGSFKAYYEKDGLPGSAISCILEDDRGDLWMSTNNGVSRMNTVTKTFSNYSTADGLPGNDLTGWSACYRSKSGEMFFGGFAGATAVRPEALSERTFVPPIALTELRLSGQTVEPLQPRLDRSSIAYAGTLTLKPSQNDFSIAFSALSFASPETNRYRYRLVGLDTTWHEIGSDRREVRYTTLPPGAYRFEAQAAVSRGPWTTPGAAVNIVALPPWWMTWWFRIIYSAAAVLLLIALYRLRLRQVAHQFQIRLEERVGERARIARELHDSLLQVFQGLMFSLQAVRDLLPDHTDKAIAQLEVALDRADQALIEGRDSVQDLRTAALADTDLAQALTSLGEELAPTASDPTTKLNVLVEGRPRNLDPLIRDEAYRIAREGLRNAFRHSKASLVECELTYTDALFRLRIRDDGQGIDQAVLKAGKRSGQWGLPGMRERAEQFGGKLTVWSAPKIGTELELTIPAKVAYG